MTCSVLLGVALAAGVPALTESRQVNLERGVQSVAFSPDGRTLVAGTSDKVVRLDPATLKRLGTLPGSEGGGWGATFSRAGHLAVAGMTDGVKVWTSLSAAPRVLETGGRRVFALAWSPDGERLAFGDSGGTWRVTPDGLSGTLKGDVMAAAWSLDGRTLFLSTGQEDSAAYALDARTGRQLWRQQNVPGTHERRAYYGLDEVNGLSVSPDGRWLASAHQDGRVLLRDAATGRLVRVLLGGQDTRWSAFTPDGARLVAVGEDGGIHVWDTASGRPLGAARVNRELWWVTVTPDSRSALTAGDDGFVRRWRLS